MKNDPFFLKEINKYLKKNAQGMSPEEMPDLDLPEVKRHVEIPLYYLKSSRTKGDGGSYFTLDYELFYALAKSNLMSSYSRPNGPFTASDIKVISQIMKDAWNKDQLPAVGVSHSVGKEIGGELQFSPMDSWKDFTTVEGFNIVTTNPTLKLLDADEERKVGFMALNGEMAIDDESFGKSEVMYLEGRMHIDQIHELRNISHNLDDDNRPELDKNYKEWKDRYEEASRRAIEAYYPPDAIPDEQPTNEIEIPFGADIDLVDSGKATYRSPDEDEMNDDIDYERELERRASADLKVLYELGKIASRLDAAGKFEDADAIDRVMVRLADTSSPITHTDSSGKVWTQIGPVEPHGMGSMKGQFIEWKDNLGNRSRFLKGTLPGSTSGKLKSKQTSEPGMLERGMNLVNKEVGNVKNMFSDKPLYEKVSPEGAQKANEWFSKL